MAAKDEKTIRRSVWLAAPLNGLFGVFAVTLGLTARAIPEYAELGPKMAATTMLVDMLPVGISALLLAALLAAILSTFAMTTLTPATIFAMDIYKGLFNKEASEAQVTTAIRVMVVILGLTIAVSAFLPPILGAINWVFAWMVPVFGYLFSVCSGKETEPWLGVPGSNMDNKYAMVLLSASRQDRWLNWITAKWLHYAGYFATNTYYW